ncbi:hypothetical protein ACVWWN_006710 [Mycobacterium sp. URHB0021]
MPKLFRRLVDYLHLGDESMAGFPAFLDQAADKFFILSTGHSTNGLDAIAGSVRFIDTDKFPLLDTRRPHRNRRRARCWGAGEGDCRADPPDLPKCVSRDRQKSEAGRDLPEPWYSHAQAYQRHRRPKRVAADEGLRLAVAKKLAKKWCPAPISRWLRRRYRRRPAWHLCTVAIYEGVYRVVSARRHETAHARAGRRPRR